MKKALLLLLIAALFLTGCVTDKEVYFPKDEPTEDVQTASATQDAVAAEDPDFSFYTLDNGIPVIIRHNESNRIQCLTVVIDGGSIMLDPAYAGLDSATLQTMCRGSESYSYDLLQYLAYDTRSSITSGSSYECSTYSLVCIDHYFDTMFPAFVDGLLNPLFTESEFENTKNDMLQSLSSQLNDPFSLMQFRGMETIFSGHPYETYPELTLESMDNITLDAVKAHHAELLNANRLKVVAVGNYDDETLITALNEALGGIGAAPFEKPDISMEFTYPEEPYVETNPNAEGTAFMGIFTPNEPADSADVYAQSLANRIYSTILFNVVREKYGTCYSVGAGSMGSLKMTDIVYIYMASDPNGLRAALDEAEAIMASGKVIAGRDETGEYVFDTIDDVLESYKNTFINAQLSSWTTNSGIADQIINGLIRENNPLYYKEFSSRLEAVTADDILRVFNKNQVANRKYWVIIAGPESVSDIDLEALTK